MATVSLGVDAGGSRDAIVIDGSAKTGDVVVSFDDSLVNVERAIDAMHIALDAMVKYQAEK